MEGIEDSSIIQPKRKQTGKRLGVLANKNPSQNSPQKKDSSKMKQIKLTDLSGPGNSHFTSKTESFPQVSGSPSTKIANNTQEQITIENTEINENKVISTKETSQNKSDDNSENTNSENVNSEKNDNSNTPEKLSFSKRNIVSILGGQYDKHNKLILAVKLKTPDKIVYTPYTVLKRKSPSILCEFFESHIVFDQ
ncbi:hypothetical protein TRFO_06660 [Tritrichomonas foetus]|uniref:Chromo shadow domain-containing protein n=1 Tax=Tritrichomonas foetus TaxID=1144522 RepID=A0A1J4K101_9EUKA|nr:hypothetical protein TRFO_06660 [Tritrichomonas foetus]|eukprot:OHT03430.1 hypothetical protein TRFO_06660 [Tritrichomonas foetus]